MNPKEKITDILQLAALNPDYARELERMRRNITILFTDIKGSTSYFERFGDTAGLLMVHHCNSLVSKSVETHGGRVIKTIGDSVMAAFEDQSAAIESAVEIQNVITTANDGKSDDQRICVRIGLNYGLGIVKSDDVFGDVVNVASRVESAAGPEQILISDSLFHSLADQDRFNVRYLGRFALKGKAEDRDLFEVIWRATGVDTTPILSHTLVFRNPAISSRARFKLVQIRKDGTSGREFQMEGDRAVLGRSDGNFVFANDQALQPRHAELSIDNGELFVEPVSEAVVFFSLVGPYRLEEGDVVKIGSQLLEFRANSTILHNAAEIGTNITQLEALLQKPIAEFVALGEDGQHFPLRDEQTTWGRSKATYVFPHDMTLSRAHAKVYHRGEDFFVEDTNSRNGTFVMARQKTPVPEGAMLSLGNQLLRAVRVSD